MTKEEIWEKLATEVKLRGFSPQTYHLEFPGILLTVASNDPR